MPRHVRVLLRVLALGVLLVAIAVQLRARRPERGPESCYVPNNRTASDTVTIRPSSFRVLVFTRHTGYEHRSIPAAIAAIHTLGARAGFTALPTEDPGAFADKVLRSFAAVIFVNTTGDILDTAEGRLPAIHSRGGRLGGRPLRHGHGARLGVVPQIAGRGLCPASAGSASDPAARESVRPALACAPSGLAANGRVVRLPCGAREGDRAGTGR